MRKENTMQWQGCQTQTAAFLIHPALFTGPFYSTDLCCVSVASTLNLVLQLLNINVLDLRMKVDIILWHCSGKVTVSTNKFIPIR